MDMFPPCSELRNEWIQRWRERWHASKLLKSQQKKGGRRGERIVDFDYLATSNTVPVYAKYRSMIV